MCKPSRANQAPIQFVMQDPGIKEFICCIKFPRKFKSSDFKQILFVLSFVLPLQAIYPPVI